MDQLVHMDHSLQVINELFPPEKPDTKFDKVLDVIKALSGGTVAGVIGQALETTIKVLGTMNAGRQKVQAIKYVSDAYEMRYLSEIEMTRLKNQSEANKNITLYIDKAFQCKMDEINKEYLYKIKKIETDKELAIVRMDQYAKICLKDIDEKYAMLIRENEGKCALYRQHLQFMFSNKITPAHLISDLSKRYLDYAIKFTLQPRSPSDCAVNEKLLNDIIKLIECIGSCDGIFISFENFIGLRNCVGG